LHPSHILFWNVCGLNLTARRDAVRTMVNSARVDVVCLKETKLCHMDRRIVLSMLRADFDNNFIFLLWIGASAGVSVAWRT
jgi:exonuclease III